MVSSTIQTYHTIEPEVPKFAMPDGIVTRGKEVNTFVFAKSDSSKLNYDSIKSFETQLTNVKGSKRTKLTGLCYSNRPGDDQVLNVLHENPSVNVLLESTFAVLISFSNGERSINKTGSACAVSRNCLFTAGHLFNPPKGYTLDKIYITKNEQTIISGMV